jgi:hypothetical protein
MDVHAESISVAVVEANGEERWLGKIAHREEAIRKLINHHDNVAVGAQENPCATRQTRARLCESKFS